MHRKIAIAAQKKIKKHTATIEELLSSNEIKILIAEFVIFIRSSTLLTSYTPSLVSTETAVETQNDYYRQLLITKISNLPTCKTEKWNKDAVKYPVQRLLNSLILSKHKNDEWALQYLAHFFSSRTLNQLFFYKSPRFSVKIKNFEAMLKSENSIEGHKNMFAQAGKTGKKHDELMLSIGLPGEIITLENNQIFYFNIILFITFFLLVKFLPPIFDLPILTFFFDAALILILYVTIGRSLILSLTRCPFSWDAAGEAIQIGLMEEISNIVFPSQHRNRVSYRPSADDLAPQPMLTSAVAPSDELRTAANNTSQSDKQEQEYKPKDKRKNRSTSSFQILSSLNSSPRIKLTWEDPNIEPLYGILITRNNKLIIDFMLTACFTRLWSMKPNINASCSHHFVFQPDGDSVDDIVAQFRLIISLGHVVSCEDNSGLVPLTTNDSDFPGALYKTKLFKTGYATYRGGLFPMTESKSIAFEDKSQSLPKSLENKVYHLLQPGPPKRTH